MDNTKVLLVMFGVLAFMFIIVVVFDNLPDVVYKNEYHNIPFEKHIQAAPKVKVRPLVKPRFNEPSFSLPCKGVTNPGCSTYRINNYGDFIRTGRLKSAYFHCTIQKEYVYKGKRYYLIWMEQEGFRSEFHIVREEGLNIIGNRINKTWKN